MGSNEQNNGAQGRKMPEPPKPNFKVDLNKESSVKHVIGVVSGKGGVGKSLVTSLLAAKTRAKGFQVGILDADVTGPSIPKAFGVNRAGLTAHNDLMVPVQSATGISIISSNLLLDNDTDPVIWRGPVIANVVKQFWSEVWWKDIDYLFVDMPPGTGDVPLTVFQSLPVEGIVIVTSPQDLVSMIVAKAVNMAEEMDIPILGIIENMSRIEEIAAQHGIPVLARAPIDPKTAEAVDQGTVEYLDADWIGPAVDLVTGVKP